MALDAAQLARLGGIKVSTDEIVAENAPIVVDSASPSAAPTILESPVPPRDPQIRIFRAMPAGCRFQFSSALAHKEIFFSHGWYETSDAKEIAELELVANKPGSIIFTDAAQDRILAAVNEAKRKLSSEGVPVDTASVLEQAIRIGEASDAAAIRPAQGVIPNFSPNTSLADPEAALQAAIRAEAGKVQSSE